VGEDLVHQGYIRLLIADPSSGGAVQLGEAGNLEKRAVLGERLRGGAGFHRGAVGEQRDAPNGWQLSQCRGRLGAGFGEWPFRRWNLWCDRDSRVADQD
jgi:hypothetical protein